MFSPRIVARGRIRQQDPRVSVITELRFIKRPSVYPPYPSLPAMWYLLTRARLRLDLPNSAQQWRCNVPASPTDNAYALRVNNDRWDGSRRA